MMSFLAEHWIVTSVVAGVLALVAWVAWEMATAPVIEDYDPYH